ncbi:MAG: hypothetical protein JF630_12520 [Geodermatophilales bacterium]|nr:hypothetical protein [Geodermatophilales bacterium]
MLVPRTCTREPFPASVTVHVFPEQDATLTAAEAAASPAEDALVIVDALPADDPDEALELPEPRNVHETEQAISRTSSVPPVSTLAPALLVMPFIRVTSQQAAGRRTRRARDVRGRSRPVRWPDDALSVPPASTRAVPDPGRRRGEGVYQGSVVFRVPCCA